MAMVPTSSSSTVATSRKRKVEEQLNQIKIVHGDVRDLNQLKFAMNECDAVIHLAALIAIPYSYFAPASYLETNVIGTYNVLQASRELGIKRVIHTSTSEVYGTAITVPIDEKHPIQTITTNGMSVAYLCEIIRNNNLSSSLFNASSSENFKGHINYNIAMYLIRWKSKNS
jgi:nucleoside-diphosphate-sugar epimerase